MTNGTVTSGSPASAIQAAWVNSINTPHQPGLVAAQLPNANCFEIFLGSTALATGPFTFSVNSCVITGNLLGCTFNPTIIEVAPVGGSVSLSVAEASSAFPSLPLAAGTVAALAMFAAGGWYVMRRLLR